VNVASATYTYPRTATVLAQQYLYLQYCSTAGTDTAAMPLQAATALRAVDIEQHSRARCSAPVLQATILVLAVAAVQVDSSVAAIKPATTSAVATMCMLHYVQHAYSETCSWHVRQRHVSL